LSSSGPKREKGRGDDVDVIVGIGGCFTDVDRQLELAASHQASEGEGMGERNSERERKREGV